MGVMSEGSCCCEGQKQGIFCNWQGLACTARATVAADLQCFGTDDVKKKPCSGICIAMSETQMHRKRTDQQSPRGNNPLQATIPYRQQSPVGNDPI